MLCMLFNVTVSTIRKKGLTVLDKRKIKRLKELAKEHNSDFERHVGALNLIKAEDSAVLDAEETSLDEHADRVSKIKKYENNKKFSLEIFIY